LRNLRVDWGSERDGGGRSSEIERESDARIEGVQRRLTKQRDEQLALRVG